MDNAMKAFRDMGKTPYYITGGGHDFPGGNAYVKATLEVLRKTKSWIPDYIFLASGTGSTQAGILVGSKICGVNVKVIGVSIARRKEYGERVIKDFMEDFCKYYDVHVAQKDILLSDNYLFGGYEKYSEQLERTIRGVIAETGIVFDTTYSGKALYGMLDFVKKNHLEKKKILFWHTGGILNALK